MPYYGRSYGHGYGGYDYGYGGYGYGGGFSYEYGTPAYEIRQLRQSLENAHFDHQIEASKPFLD